MLAARVCFWLEPPGDPPFKLCRSDWPGEAGSCHVSSFEHPTGWKPRLSPAGGPAFSCCIQEGTGQMPTLPGRPATVVWIPSLNHSMTDGMVHPLLELLEMLLPAGPLHPLTTD